MEMEKNERSSYICVNCGNSVKSLYKQYSPSVLKLCNCEYCGNVADKYIEYDNIIIVIDLILLSKEAYRHILFNIQCKSPLKLALLLLITIALDEWIYSENPVNFQDSDGLYESTLYVVCFTTVLGKTLFSLVILIFLYSYNCCNKINMFDLSNTSIILKAIIFSSFGYFLLLTVLIWDDFQREIHILFIETYTLLSQVQALSVTTSVPRSTLGVICIIGFVVDHLFCHGLKRILGI